MHVDTAFIDISVILYLTGLCRQETEAVLDIVRYQNIESGLKFTESKVH